MEDEGGRERQGLPMKERWKRRVSDKEEVKETGRKYRVSEEDLL